LVYNTEELELVYALSTNNVIIKNGKDKIGCVVMVEVYVCV
jgi:hypothetical protein